MNQLTLGCDPEIFVGSVSGPRSIVGLIGGSKDVPRPLPQLGDGYAVQEDNVAMEFNTPPAASKALFVQNVATCRDFLERMVHDMHGLHLLKDSAISFPDSELLTPASMQFGCDPDFDAYTGKANARPMSSDKNLRSCGGHVHIGVRGTKYASCEPRSIIKSCDLHLGIPSVLMDNGELRKQLYGKAGAFRIKPYGVEYRTLSNFWVFENGLMEWVYDNTERALDAVLNAVSFDEDADLIRDTINNNDKATAHRLVEKYKLSLQ